MRKNSDLTVDSGKPVLTDEKSDLYSRYQRVRHGDHSPEDRGALEQFLYQSPVETIEFNYRQSDGRLLAVGICDICAQSLSSVYFFYDPGQLHRGLGIYGALTEIEYARRRGIGYYYLGYWVRGCAAMAYKTGFSPYEALNSDGIWRRAGPEN